MKKLVIIGIGEIANIAYEFFKYDTEYEVCAFCVHKKHMVADRFRDLPVIVFENMQEDFPANEFEIFIGIGTGELNYQRTRIYKQVKQMGYKCATYVSSKAFVWHNVEVGENCFILPHNTLEPFVKIGNNVTLWSGNHIGHQSVVKDNVFISSHVVISGFCEIGENTFMGVNSCVAHKIKIAKDNFIALGSVVNKNTEENKIYRGNPAEASKISAKKFCKVKE
ncbi:acetyltransferase [Campylobacter jejuni]|uniref:acetyltransferase n=1 Tax=Campylobacter jejuni TaxID=197 RepID=UPI000B4BC911|nr:acetyltransferase [Campylobacter jejuni]EAI4070944.1 acetyltransferase [Campylobacter jejuni]OWK88049.1 sugar O-acyltransferase [Campylobacter jejuni]